jgi:hypothetical protein
MTKKILIYQIVFGIIIIIAIIIIMMPQRIRQSLWTRVTNTNKADLQTSQKPPANPPEIPVTPTKHVLMAKVNGEPIYVDEVEAGIAQRRFGMSADDAMTERLDSLVSLISIKQYLKEQHINISDEEVEKQVAELRINPPAAGCACCRYKSLEEYLAAALFTMKDLRDNIRNELGMDKYITALWDADFPIGEKRDGLLAENRKRIENDYSKISHIFFNTVQQPDYQTNPDGVREKAKVKAVNVLGKLQKGEEFTKLAKEYSEDAFSRTKGGDLGCIPNEIFGPELAKAVQQLKPGELSQPVESPWGFHIIRRETISEQDMMSVLESDYKEKKAKEINDGIKMDLYVERFDTETDGK